MKNWEIKKLGEVCSFFNGQAHEKCIDENGKFKLINSKFVSSEGKNFKSTNNALSPLFVDDIVMVMSDVPNGKTLAKCFIVDEDDTYTLNQRICVFRSKKFVIRFLYYQLNRNKYFLSFDNGENQSNLRKDDILNCELFVPPISIQQEIVSILDDAFESIERAKSNAEQNLKNAKELFDSYLQNIFEKKGKGWLEMKLNDVCKIGDGNYSSKYPKASDFISNGIPFLTATNLKNGTIVDDGIRFISKELHSTLKKGHVIKGDLVIVVRGSSTGNNSIVPQEYDGSNLNAQLAYLRVNEDILSSEYLFAIFNSPIVMKILKASITGSAQPQLPNNKLLDIKIFIPNSEEQLNIVKKLTKLSSEIKKLDGIYRKRSNDLGELKKSILQKAFNGELKTSKISA